MYAELSSVHGNDKNTNSPEVVIMEWKRLGRFSYSTTDNWSYLEINIPVNNLQERSSNIFWLLIWFFLIGLAPLVEAIVVLVYEEYWWLLLPLGNQIVATFCFYLFLVRLNRQFTREKLRITTEAIDYRCSMLPLSTTLLFLLHPSSFDAQELGNPEGKLVKEKRIVPKEGLEAKVAKYDNAKTYGACLLIEDFELGHGLPADDLEEMTNDINHFIRRHNVGQSAVNKESETSQDLSPVL